MGPRLHHSEGEKVRYVIVESAVAVLKIDLLKNRSAIGSISSYIEGLRPISVMR